MSARNPVKRNERYGAQELRRPIKGHPRLDECLAEEGSPPVTINPVQPSTTPKVLRNRTYDIDALIPILLLRKNNFYSPPPPGQQLRWEIACRKRRVHEEIMILARGELAGQEWMESHAPQLKVKQPWPPGVDGPSYLTACKASLFARIPKLGRNRNNLSNKAVIDYLIDQISIVILLERHLVYFNNVYTHFASIANDNFRGGLKTGKEVSLGRIIEAFTRLPSVLTDDELLDVAFYGLIDSSVIHLDHHVMSDLLGLAASLGRLRYGTFDPTYEQARAYLYAVGSAPDPSPYRDRLATHRQRLAERMIARAAKWTVEPVLQDVGLMDLQSRLTEVCRAIVDGRPIPEELRRFKLHIIP